MQILSLLLTIKLLQKLILLIFGSQINIWDFLHTYQFDASKSSLKDCKTNPWIEQFYQFSKVTWSLYMMTGLILGSYYILLFVSDLKQRKSFLKCVQMFSPNYSLRAVSNGLLYLLQVLDAFRV